MSVAGALRSINLLFLSMHKYERQRNAVYFFDLVFATFTEHSATSSLRISLYQRNHGGQEFANKIEIINFAGQFLNMMSASYYLQG